MNAVVFDVGETLVDETRSWERAADACGVSRFTLMALVGAAVDLGSGSSHHPDHGLFQIFQCFAQCARIDQDLAGALPCILGLR